MLKSIFQKKSLKDTLIEKGLIDEDKWSEIEAKSFADEITEFAAASKIFGSDPKMSSALAEYAMTKFIPLRELPKISNSVFDGSGLSKAMIIQSHMMPFELSDDKSTIKIAFSDPTDGELIENIELRTGKTVDAYYGSWEDIDAVLLKYFGDFDASKAAAEYARNVDVNQTAATSNVYGGTTDGSSPIVTIVNSIIDCAARLKASDIHIEPFDSTLRVRYRIDGALAEQPSYSMQMHSAIIARLKIMGGMDISEKRIPQDGRITYMVDKTEYDIRVSMLPTVYGEKCVMRLALKANLKRDKQDLGLTAYDLKIFDKIFANPNGIILVTGPTGSGKSTTLYTALSELSTEEVNIVTVEDPVEANVDGVNQVHTNAKAGLTFASALRSILRQDPDIIMIGEIRDGETAEIAVQAAITGHLVVSTLHTNSSAASVTRLINMGLEPYLVADSVVGILAQRLVRRLCNKCKKERYATPEEVAELGLKPGVNVKIHDKCGCAYCNNTGYSGRIAVYEIMDVGPEIKEMIVNNSSTSKIKEIAVKNGMHTLHRSASELVIRGITTMSEMRKVSSES